MSQTLGTGIWDTKADRENQASVRSPHRKGPNFVGEGAAPFEAAVEVFTKETCQAAIRWMARDLKHSVFDRRPRYSKKAGPPAGEDLHGEAGRLRLRAAAEGVLGPPRAFQAELNTASRCPKP
jgi:hypothetical protein